jgi:hypothetical protein
LNTIQDSLVQFSVTSIVLLTMMVFTPLAPGCDRVVRVTVFGLRTPITVHAESGPLPTLVIFTVYPSLCHCAMVSCADSVLDGAAKVGAANANVAAAMAVTVRVVMASFII